ncbi:transposase [Argonema antarcticum]|uniref:transposase n=1 Tax=Argonema antarcticum TaxID=2942763 RepID=UPI0020132591|nr:transposase [Argonema antarcticum]MCL1472994.1 transposase [Argonema antarcticum A004/B2]
MLRSFKTKLKLDRRQATVMARHAGYSRSIYNWTLRLWGEGKIFENPKPYRRAIKKIKRLQRQLSRKVNLSKNWSASRQKQRCAHQKVFNICQNTLHQITYYLAKNHSQIVIEDFNVSEMMKCPR